MSRTIKEVIETLSKIENQEQPILAVWWLASTFEDCFDTDNPTPEQFGEILDKSIIDYTDVSEQLYDLVYYFMREIEDNENEREEK